MSQNETQQQPRSQSRQDSPSVNGTHDGQQKTRGPKKGGNRQYSEGGETRAPRTRTTGEKGDRREGGSRRGGRREGGDSRPVTKDSRTIYVGKVFTDDLDGSNIAEKLKEQRIKYLRDVLEQFGAIESFDAQVGDAYALVTYETHKAADDALKALRNREEVDNILDRVQNKLTQSKLPSAVCPDLQRYKYSWSDKPSSNRARTAGVKGNSQLPKNVVAKKTSDQQAPSPTTAPQTASQQAPKPKKAHKPKVEEEQVEVQPQQTQQPKTKKTQRQNVQQQAQTTTVSPKTQQGADDLQREAERARLTQDLTYLRQQQLHVSQELSAESDRCRARDERINRLSEELSRVRAQEQFLEGQLKAEQNWKQAAEERIVKLTEEVTHFVQEQKQVEKRLTTVSQQLNNTANGL